MLGLWIALLPVLGGALAATQELRLPVGIQFTCVDQEAIGYATFQSHNQKVLVNRKGIFLTYLRRRNEAYTAQEWRLMRSIDGGQTFSVVYDATHATNPPVMETDAEDNVYLVRSDFLDGNAYLFRFLASRDYQEPILTPIPGGAAGKYCMSIDPERRLLYYFAHNNTFHILSMSGEVLSSRTLIKDGPDACLQYPHLFLDQAGVLHIAWTSLKHGEYLYWDIHYMASRDGGKTWQAMNGTPIDIPVTADQTSQADRITLDDEFSIHTWLSSFRVENGKAHFLYLAQTNPGRQHYVRYDLESGKRDRDFYPDFHGDQISVAGLDGFFAGNRAQINGPLFCVHSSQGRLACLVSNDKGDTWHDYALSQETFRPYAIGGCREVTPAGEIIGTFTDQLAPGTSSGGRCPVYFFKVARQE